MNSIYKPHLHLVQSFSLLSWTKARSSDIRKAVNLLTTEHQPTPSPPQLLPTCRHRWVCQGLGIQTEVTTLADLPPQIFVSIHAYTYHAVCLPCIEAPRVIREDCPSQGCLEELCGPDAQLTVNRALFPVGPQSKWFSDGSVWERHLFLSFASSRLLLLWSVSSWGSPIAFSTSSLAHLVHHKSLLF